MNIKNNMYGIIVILIVGLSNARSVLTENGIFPGLRKVPQSWQSEPNNVLAELSSIIEEQARRRFQEQRPFQHHNNYAGKVISGPGFTYKYPKYTPNETEETQFAVDPSHPKYYEKIPTVDQSNAESALSSSSLPLLLPSSSSSSLSSSLSSLSSSLSHKNADSEVISNVDMPSYKLKPPMEVNPSNVLTQPKNVFTREDILKLMETLQRNGDEEAIVNFYPHDVLKKHVDIDMNTAMGMYVIALIAGISAAVTVGLLAIGIGWYTLQKKAKAAADVEYPAYGVTGPNKEVSPSTGDRRLAQSAQMYHYQHQKQQIIAMENQNSGDHNGSMSDIDTDEENEEGDYTVYECPGLAPTGEMEVKNPLFLDDPTPIPKSTIVAKKQQQHQQAEQQSQLSQQKQQQPPKQQQQQQKSDRKSDSSTKK